MNPRQIEITVMEPFQRTALFYAYARQFHLAPGTFSTLTLDDRVFLDLRWIPHYLLTELQKDDVSKLFAVQHLRVVVFPDEECRMALRTVECGDHEVLRKEVKETLQRLLDVQHER